MADAADAETCQEIGCTQKEPETASENETVRDLLQKLTLIQSVSLQESKGEDALRGKLVGLFLGPYWLPATFQQTLESFKELELDPHKSVHPTAFVYVPTDRDDNLIDMLIMYGEASQIDTRPDEEIFTETVQKLPEGWLAVPFAESASRSSLIHQLKSGVFSLAFVGEDGRINTKDGLQLLEKWGADAYPFTEDRIEELQQETRERSKTQTLAGLLVCEDRDHLIQNDGSEVKVSSLEGKTVGLYFSAHWCPPCQRFTPVLADIYLQLKSQNKQFEVVFVSWDEDQPSFLKYHAEMPWLALPFADSKTKKKLSRWFSVEGIPTLILLDPTGKTLHVEGAELLSKHGVEAYPFTAEKLAELDAREDAKRARQTIETLLATESRDFVISPDGQEVKISSIKNKTVGLYFSAHWCPPCRNFTPLLKSTYNELQEQGKDFEIVFISSDRDDEAFKSYHGSMPWLALPFWDRKSKSALTSYFDVQGIPYLEILGPDGKTVTSEGIELISQHGSSAFPFTEARLSELNNAKDEAASKLPKEIYYSGHPDHPLILSNNPYDGQNYICDKCDGQGNRWSYHCDECSYDLHLSCAQVAPPEKAEETDNAQNLENKPTSEPIEHANAASKISERDGNEDDVAERQDEHKSEWICEGDVCRRA